MVQVDIAQVAEQLWWTEIDSPKKRKTKKPTISVTSHSFIHALDLQRLQARTE